jgi:hypothetical protein
MREGLSEAGLRAFRVAATLAAVAPSVRVRICDGERLLTEVRRPPLPIDAEHRVVPPCVFRLAVAHAREVAALGKAVAFVGVPIGGEPTIHIGLTSGDLTLPGGIWRIGHHDHWTHLFATTLPLAEAIAAATDGSPPARSGASVRFGFHYDELTAITLVHVNGPAGDHAAAGRDLDVLEATLARCATAELLAHLAEPPDSRSRPPA